MENFLFIKYYYTSNEIEQMFEEMQVTVEDKIEKAFSNTNCFFQFIDVSQSAYISDIIEVEATFSLTEADKHMIFDICKENVYFIDDLDDSPDREKLIDLYEKKHNLMYAKFREIDNDDLIIDTKTKSVL